MTNIRWFFSFLFLWWLLVLLFKLSMLVVCKPHGFCECVIHKARCASKVYKPILEPFAYFLANTHICIATVLHWHACCSLEPWRTIYWFIFLFVNLQVYVAFVTSYRLPICRFSILWQKEIKFTCNTWIKIIIHQSA
jgi:hypothetical protein